MTLKDNTLQEIETNEVIFKEEINILNTKIEDMKRLLINSNTKYDKTISTFDITNKSVANQIQNSDFLVNEINALKMEVNSKEEEIKAFQNEAKLKNEKIAQLEKDLKERVGQYEEKIFFLANKIKKTHDKDKDKERR